MAISIDPLTYIITVPTADLTFVSGSLYNHDTDAFRLELKDWEDNAQGIVHPKTHDHNTTVTIVGINYVRAIQILAPYQVQYEDGPYSVILLGSNNNIWDIQGGILIRNQVQVIPTNAAGLIVAETGTSGLTPSESAALLQNTADLATMTASMTSVEGDIGIIQTDISSLQSDVATLTTSMGNVEVDISSIKDDIITIKTDIGLLQIDVGSIQIDMAFIKAIESGEWKIENNQMIFYDLTSAEIARFDLFDGAGVPTMDTVLRRVPV